MARPVCTTDEVEMICTKNGVGLLTMIAFGPYVMFEADEYTCPTCSHRVIVGQSAQGVYQHEGNELQSKITWHTKAGTLRLIKSTD